MNTLHPSNVPANTSAQQHVQPTPASAAGARPQVAAPSSEHAHPADDALMAALEREHGPVGDYQEAVEDDDDDRAAWLPTGGTAGVAAEAAATDATATLGTVGATGEATGAVAIEGAAQGAQVAAQAVVPTTSKIGRAHV